ncbi:A24 family peptidase [Aneurinibacillus thermoaerophilus]|uniref:prepilin peptidase n=1 Tax=Aneurinibacillus thermoaerophilus TaxID=143495 RepID=UPI002EB5CA9A|nr:A24 family peptidase [Aneurinibacillus thermoaerophilus]
MSTFLFYTFLAASLYVTYTDIRYRRIPDKITLTLFFGLLLYRIAEGSILYYLPGLLLTAGLLFAVAYWSNGGIGGGDIKLMAAYAMYFPVIGSVAVLVFSHIYGILYGLAYLLIKKKHVEIPLAPGFLIGFVLSSPFLLE